MAKIRHYRNLSLALASTIHNKQQTPEPVLESSGPYCIYTRSRGHYWTDV